MPNEPSGAGRRRSVLRVAQWMSARVPDATIVVSKHLAEHFRERYGRPTTYIPNGVEEPTRRPPDEITRRFGLRGRDYVLFVGRLVPEKAPDLLLGPSRHSRAIRELVIAGGSSYTDDYVRGLMIARGVGPPCHPARLRLRRPPGGAVQQRRRLRRSRPSSRGFRSRCSRRSPTVSRWWRAISLRTGKCSDRSARLVPPGDERALAEAIAEGARASPPRAPGGGSPSAEGPFRLSVGGHDGRDGGAVRATPRAAVTTIDLAHEPGARRSTSPLRGESVAAWSVVPLRST